MGIFRYSRAEVISLEPEKIKKLIEEICTDDDYSTAPVYDLRIEDNSVFFNSKGYGCYGSDEGYLDLLFEILTEKYKVVRAQSEFGIACFEYVTPCQDLDYLFAIIYIQVKDEISTHFFGLSLEEHDVELDCDTEDEKYKYGLDLEVDLNYSNDRCDYREEYIMVIEAKRLENNPLWASLNAIYEKCGKNKRNIVTRHLIDSWLFDDAISDDEWSSAMQEFELYAIECDLKYQGNNILKEYGGHLPNNFPRFKTGESRR